MFGREELLSSDSATESIRAVASASMAVEGAPRTTPDMHTDTDRNISVHRTIRRDWRIVAVANFIMK